MKKKRVAVPVKKQLPAMKKVCHKGYTAVQSNRNFHVMIGKGGKMVSHASVDHPMTEDELRQAIDEYISLAGKVGAVQ